jgi:hypothetical protein
MTAAAVTLPEGLDARARWTLESLVQAAGGWVVEAGAPGVDPPADLDACFAHLARSEEVAELAA